MLSRPIVPLVVASALFMENMDGTVLSTSLPAIALDLGVDPIILKLAFTSYLLSLAVFIPVSGWCADRFGARLVFRTAIVVFTLGSLACAFTSTLGGFIAARALQGLGGALMVPVGRLVILRTVPKRELVTALAYLTVPALVGPIAGPPLGGFITTYFHWRWIFWINVPMGVLGVVLATLFIPDIREQSPRPLDVVGFLLSGLGLSSLIFGLTIIGRDVVPGWAVAILVAFGGTMLAFYRRHAMRTAHPIIDLKLLRIPTFTTSVVGGFLFRTGIGSVPFLLPLMLQIGFHLTPFQSGLLTFAAAAGAFVMKFTARSILERIGFRTVLVWNAIISACFLAGNALFTPLTPHAVILVVLLVGGFFRSLQFTSLNAIAYSDIPPERMSQATSFANVVQQLSGSVGVALAALVLEGTRWASGDPVLTYHDFGLAFVVVALVAVSSSPFHARLAPDAGSEISGHHRARVRAETDEATEPAAKGG
jgi:EmrB/QacA subfamily drug resistance transporter